MISFKQAQQTILQNVTVTGIEQISLLEASGRVLAKDIIAPWDMPLWDNSAMDGYAVCTADVTSIPCKLKVKGFLPAGAKADSVALESGNAIRIMTGAPTPVGCDAIVPFEETDNGDQVVTLQEQVQQWQHFRFRGEDVKSGEVCLRSGSVLRPPEINMLASLGMALVPVYRRPKVAIISTGDELVELGRTPGPGEIINSNILSLAAAVSESGGIPLVIGIARDNRESHMDKLRQGVKADALITSAGVSAGDCDLVRDVLAEMGAQQLFWKVAVKTGGPTGFALLGSTPIFSLPGHPVSAMITFEEFVRPALLRMQGHRLVFRPLVKAVLREELKKKPGKLQIVRVYMEKEDGKWYASSAGNQQTAILKTMVNANALALLTEESTRFAAGDEVDVHFYGNYIELVGEA
ncbi:MAG: gephyrin-like molybdotransferase Glp [Deltaproteobacteria bacterium]